MSVSSTDIIAPRQRKESMREEKSEKKCYEKKMKVKFTLFFVFYDDSKLLLMNLTLFLFMKKTEKVSSGFVWLSLYSPN